MPQLKIADLLGTTEAKVRESSRHPSKPERVSKGSKLAPGFDGLEACRVSNLSVLRSGHTLRTKRRIVALLSSFTTGLPWPRFSGCQRYAQ